MMAVPARTGRRAPAPLPPPDDPPPLVPFAATPPALSRSLRVEVERVLDPHDESQGLFVTQTDRAQAALAIADLGAFLEPVGYDQFQAWLGGVNAGVRFPIGQADFGVRLDAMYDDCRHLPRACFTRETRLELFALLSKSARANFPGTGDVLTVAAPLERKWRRQLRALRIIAEGRPAALRIGPPAAMEPPKPGHVEAQLASLRKHMGDLEERRGDRPKPSRVPALSPEARLAAHEAAVAAGGPMAEVSAIAVAALRRAWKGRRR